MRRLRRLGSLGVFMRSSFIWLPSIGSCPFQIARRRLSGSSASEKPTAPSGITDWTSLPSLERYGGSNGSASAASCSPACLPCSRPLACRSQGRPKLSYRTPVIYTAADEDLRHAGRLPVGADDPPVRRRPPADQARFTPIHPASSCSPESTQRSRTAPASSRGSCIQRRGKS